MDAAELERYLHERIPLSRAMAVRVARAGAGTGVLLQAPLGPNINHRDTVFGGSAAAVATLAAWSVVRTELEAASQPGRIVIRRSTMDYEQPITGDFEAESAPPEPQPWQRLLASLRRGRMGRIVVRSVLFCDGTRVGAFDGEFAVIPS